MQVSRYYDITSILFPIPRAILAAEAAADAILFDSPASMIMLCSFSKQPFAFVPHGLSHFLHTSRHPLLLDFLSQQSYLFLHPLTFDPTRT